MRKSLSRKGARLVGAGFVVSAVGAALLVAPQASFAAVTAGVVTPPLVAASQTGVKLTDSQLTSGSGVQISSGTTCPATYSTAGASNTTPWVPTQTPATGVVTFTVPAQLTANTNGIAKPYMVCGYAGTVAATSALLSTGTLWVGVSPTAFPNTGPVSGNNLVTISGGVNGAIFTGSTAPAAIFTTGNCTSTYGTPTGLAVPVNRLGDSAGTLNVPAGLVAPGPNPQVYNICLYGGNTSSNALISALPYNVAVAVPSQSSGPAQSGTGPNITFASVSPIFAGLSTVGVSFTGDATCGANYNTTATANNSDGTVGNILASVVRKMGDRMIAVTVPSLYTNSKVYQACIYNGVTNGTSALIASAPYSTTTVQTVSGVSPGAGPAIGGNKITVSGANFPTTTGAISATLGGAPLADITPTSSSAFTATVPSHAPGGATLVVTTPAGTTVTANAYAYTSALRISPNTAPNTLANVDMVIEGVGFQSSTWNTNTLNGAHVYLVPGVYDPSSIGGDRANPPVAECTSVLPLSDSLLVCGLQLNRRLGADGTALYATPAPAPFTITTVNGSHYITATAGTFTKMMVGMMLGSANLLPNAKITAVIDGTHALVSANATVTGSGAAAVVVAASSIRSATTSVAVTAQGAVPAISGGVTSSDVGLTAYGPDLLGDSTAGANVIASTTALTSVTTAAIASPIASEAVLIYAPTTYVPVPEGPYQMTYVNDGNVGANSTNPNYEQSTVSSSATFTVAAF